MLPLLVRVDLRAMAMKEFFTFHEAPASSWSLIIRLFNIISRYMQFTEEFVMCVEKHVITQKTVTGFDTMNPSQKDFSLSGNTNRLTCKENFQAVSKEGYADSLLRHEKKTHNYWCSWKRCNYKQYFQLPIPFVIFTLICNYFFSIRKETLSFMIVNFRV